jgi:hypothetical protein
VNLATETALVQLEPLPESAGTKEKLAEQIAAQLTKAGFKSTLRGKIGPSLPEFYCRLSNPCKTQVSEADVRRQVPHCLGTTEQPSAVIWWCSGYVAESSKYPGEGSSHCFTVSLLSASSCLFAPRLLCPGCKLEDWRK